MNTDLLTASGDRPVYAGHQESGITLFVSLVFLTILTLLGLAAMTSTSLEGAMANNQQDSDLAFQAAETALRQAETYVGSTLTPGAGFNASCTGGSGGLCLPSTTSQPDWSRNGGVAQWGYPATNTVRTMPNVGNAYYRGPEYIVELLPNLPPSNGSLRIGYQYQAATATAYRITAMGWGARPSSVAMLQTIFIKN